MREKEPLISILVPVYQVAPYLGACIDSIVCQTIEDWELLLVDDGSTDGSGEICDEYAGNDRRIRVIHQKNAGLAAARNTGLRNAKGRYITMVDSDDLLLRDDYIEILYDALLRNDAELSVCGSVYFNDGEEPPPAEGTKKDLAVLSGAELFGCAGSFLKAYSFACAHQKLYTREILEGIVYPEGRVFEDISVSDQILYPCRRIAVTDMRMYGYRIRKESISHGLPVKKLMHDAVCAYTDRIHFYNEIGRNDLAMISEQNLIRYLNYIRKNNAAS